MFIVDGSTLEEVEKQLRQFKESIRIVNRFRPARKFYNPLVFFYAHGKSVSYLNLVTAIDSSISLNLNGSHNHDRNSTAVKMSQVSPPPPPAISVVTFRWDDEDINKRNKGEPDR